MNANITVCPTCHRPLPHDPRDLTPRELEVCALLADRTPTKKIAASLVIELSTVKNHIYHVMQKLGVENRLQAGAWYSDRYKAE